MSATEAVVWIIAIIAGAVVAIAAITAYLAHTLRDKDRP